MAQESEKVVFVSHPIRGKRFSKQRRDDLQAIGVIVEALRKKLRSITNKEPLRPIVPYRLHGDVLETEEMVVAYRAGCGDYAYDELHLYGDAICAGMRAEIKKAIKRGIPVIPKTKETACLFAELQALAA